MVRAMWILALLFSLANALEVQGFLTSDCQKKIGVTVNVKDRDIDIINLQGQHERLNADAIETLYIFNVIDNPISTIQVDEDALKYLRAVYTDDSPEPRALAFPARFIEDLVVFFSLDGKSHVYTFADIYKIRPASSASLGSHKPAFQKATTFDFSSQSGKCEASPGVVKATRVLADKISISEFLNAMDEGYDALASFEERTYLYARPFLFEKSTRLGLVFIGKRDEPGINFPMYFQWSTGEPYRFQSFNVFGSKVQEFAPNAEPVFAIRSDVKSHFFHGLFMGNVLGIPAGSTVFDSFARPSGDVTVQPSFNYMALMGADYGPYSASVGFYFPSFGIRVGEEYREVRGSSVSYAIRGMYTKSKFRVRAVGAATKYESASAKEEEVTARTGKDGTDFAPNSFKFDAVFVRGGFDFDLSDKIRIGTDLISVTGNYKEKVGAQANDIRFKRITIQPYIQQHFSHYVSITAYADLIQNTFEANFLNQDNDREQRESRFFGTFEFIF